MRIAARFFLAVVVGLLCAGITEVLAQTSLTEVAAVQAAPSVSPATASTITAKAEKMSNDMASGPSGIMVPQAHPAMASAAPSSSSEKGSKKINTAIPTSNTPVASMDSVKDVIERLSSAEDFSTLEDLNSAREAIAKLDVLIDIEKRLADLSKLREDRGEVSSKPSTSVIPMPASALMPMNVVPSSAPMESSAPVMVERKPAIVDAPTASIKIERIYGVGGDYSAMLKVDGRTTSVKTGEKLSDGSIVRSISKTGVKLVKNKKERTIKVNDVVVSDSSM